MGADYRSELENSNFGILCITPKNISSEWIMFEAGALSKAMQNAKVIPLLFGLELSDLSGPLQQFEAEKVDEQGMLDTLKAINSASENKTDDATIEQLVPALWSQLQAKLDAIPKRAKAEKHMRPQTEIMEGLVAQVRGLNGRVRDFDPEMMAHEMRFSRTKSRRIHPEMIRFLSQDSSRGGAYTLVMLAGFLRDTMPWISEILVEVHRELKYTSLKQAEKIVDDFKHTLNFVIRSRFAKMMTIDSQQSYMLMKELQLIVEEMLNDLIQARRIDAIGKREIESDDYDKIEDDT